MAQATQIHTESPLCMSFEEFLDWLDQEHNHGEWVDGEVIRFLPTSEAHVFIFKFLLHLLDFFVLQHNLGTVYAAPFLMRLSFRPSGREPDLMFVAHAHSDRRSKNYLIGPADLAIEIVSPDSIERDREVKKAEYEAGGVQEYWIIDPLTQEALFYQRDESGKYRDIPAGAEGRYESAVVEGFWLNVNWLWQDPLPLLEAARELRLMA